MKIKLTDKKRDKGYPFPKLMIDEDGSIYFMQHDGCGTLIVAGEGISSSVVGDYFDELDMSNIEDFDSELTLSND